MTDQHPRPDHASDQPTGGDSRVDALLIEGLEYYFEGQFEHAIHIWTRVLFLDRHQPSARAYIERARAALAERQRQSDESLQAVAGLLDRGRAVEARTRLAQVLASTGDDERTAALRLRLERLERATGGAPRIHAVATPATPWWHHGLALANYRLRRRELVVGAVLVCLVAVMAIPALRESLGFLPTTEPPVFVTTPVAVPVLSGAEVALIRARALYARGRLAEALAVLDRVGPEQAEQIERHDADRLRVEIQRVLLATTSDSR